MRYLPALLLALSMRAIAAPELCNGIDDDGDTFIDEGPVAAYNDSDGDGRGDRATVVWSVDCASQPAELINSSTDCADDDPNITPGSAELIINGIDDDCDGVIDEDVIPSDTDCAMYYDDDSAFIACDEYREWRTASALCSDRGYHLATIDDSAENDVLWIPLRTEFWWIGYYEETANNWVWESGSSSYDNFDEDEPNGGGDLTCAFLWTGTGDWYDWYCNNWYPYICEADCVAENTFADTDADGLGDPGDVLVSCTLPAGRVWNSADCDDTNSNITTRIWFEDLDGDGDGSDIMLGPACDSLPNSVDTSGDCNDTEATINPGLTESCDTDFDDDCDGYINDDDDQLDITTAFPYYPDGDDDGYGAGAFRVSCVAPEGFADNDGDCDDSDGDIHPEASERCNDADDDCDGNIDEDILTEWYADADGDGAGNPNVPIDDCDPQDASDNGTDCDDTDSSRYPGAIDLPDDSIDQDCDGTDALGDLNGGDEFPQTGGKFNGRNRTGTVGCTCEQPARAPGLHALVLLALLASARRHNRQPPL